VKSRYVALGSMPSPKFARIGLLMLLICGQCSLSAQGASPTTRSKNAVALIPFVGCESDGQLGSSKAPSGRSKQLAIPAAAAQRLAYYTADERLGVLAPKGWHCFGTYGSSGTSLYVSHDPINVADLFSTNWKGFAGQVVQISYEYGGTSGRFGVAETIARVFPAHKAFVKKVIAEGIEPASSFPFGPYPADTLTYRTGNVVEFATPPRAEGLGTASRLQKSDIPIIGVAILEGEEPNLVRLWVRLPLETNDLAQFIIQETEQEAARFGHSR
jgi:hypothetical protein